MGLNYLELRVWVGIWVGLLTTLIVAFDLSYIVIYITRYTEESFSTLISLIFITDGFKKLWHIIDQYPVDTTWKKNDVLNYTCHCRKPSYESSDDQTWFTNMTTLDWKNNATGISLLSSYIIYTHAYRENCSWWRPNN